MRHLQSNGIMTRSDMVRYCINNCRNWGRITTRWWTHKNTPYLPLTGELLGAFWEYLWENWLRCDGSTLYWVSKQSSNYNPIFCTEPKKNNTVIKKCSERQKHTYPSNFVILVIIDLTCKTHRCQNVNIMLIQFPFFLRLTLKTFIQEDYIQYAL